MSPKRHTITAALPYANGPVHIGHMAGCYLPADIYARYLRSKGEDVAFICGSDEHGVAITLKARQEGTTPQAVVDKYHTLIRDSFQDVGISFDIYSRTTSPEHYKTASDFFTTLYENGVFIKKVSTQYYDAEVGQFLADRYIRGTCPNCGNENAYGDQCEKCGKSLDPSDLINPVSAFSGKTPELKETEHWYLPLQKYESFLRDFILKEHADWKPNVLGQCRSWIEQGLHERSITRDMDWGVPVPLPDAKGKVLYVWMDAPIGYISFTKQWAEKTGKDWRQYWESDDTSLVQFIGKDNIVFHCIIFPTMLHAHGRFILPSNVPANEFLNIEGEKVSTSRNWAVWVHEYVKDFPGKQDVLRYVLTSIAPETKDSDFTWKDFQARNNNELAAILGNLINRIVVLNYKFFEGKVPDKHSDGELEKQFVSEVKQYPELIGSLIESFKFREAQQELMNLARTANKYLTDSEPWKIIKTDPEKAATTLHYCSQLVAELSILAEPFMPFTAIKIREAFGVEAFSWGQAGTLKLLSNGGPISQLSILFEKIEDDIIEKQIEKLKGNKVEQTAINSKEENPKIEVQKENISFDEFQKIDLRTGTILTAERVPKTDKLLKLSVDMGYEVRTVVSGIAESFDPADIIGKQICIVANLAPRTIKGIESKGMILLTERPDGKLEFVIPEKHVGNGSIVR